MSTSTRGWTRARKLDHYIDKSGGPDACWLWKASTDTVGYGSFEWRKKKHKAHRAAWSEAYQREIPPGMVICHKCDVRRCCNPAHLFLGTQLENIADRNAKGRQARGAALAAVLPRGQDHPTAKLSLEEAREIKAATGSHSNIAARYGIAQSTVTRIKNGKRWSHINV